MRLLSSLVNTTEKPNLFTEDYDAYRPRIATCYGNSERVVPKTDRPER